MLSEISKYDNILVKVFESLCSVIFAYHSKLNNLQNANFELKDEQAMKFIMLLLADFTAIK